MRKINCFKILYLLLIHILLLLPLNLCIAAESMTGQIPGQGKGGYNPLGGPAYPVNPDSYFTDDYGNILMYVNVLGMVRKTGQFIVRENADFKTVLTLTGGFVDEANMQKVLVIRHKPDENGEQTYVVDLKPFYKKGDNSGFIALKPNDTIIFTEKGISLAKIARTIGMISPFVYVYDLLSR